MNIHQIEMRNISGEIQPLNSYKGKTILIVNVASACGLTPQYKGLEELFQKYKDQGFVVLGFPCNQFGAQEPGSDAEIIQFCSTEYSVTFPMYSKVEVNGENKCDLYKVLSGNEAKFPGDVTWNFEKFLINSTGEVIARFSPKTTPDDAELIAKIEAELN